MKISLWKLGPTFSVSCKKHWKWLPRFSYNWIRGKYGEKACWFSWLCFRGWAYL